MRRSLIAAGGLALTVTLLAGCSDDGSHEGSSGTTTPAPPSSSAPTTPGQGTSSEGDSQVEGLIGFPGMTCVLFQGTDGTAYALTGPGVTPAVRKLSRGGIEPRARLTDKPTVGPAVQTKVHVTGHVAAGAKSTCGKDVFVTSSVVVVNTSA
ncbi:hypothetical protein [Luteipulveratus mongoliensis]|uniref:Lipoprotein n=1 Tax=Luteipulveratus mongoliensis TaxID=571913 RepID=A0A0K1JNU5_9MICO|nr:hypothetical protein [Luteipulveratus mongoliensis]AKU18386.1 hypothetical protein VV02_25290 [Luteipulveratus mongoliensis]